MTHTDAAKASAVEHFLINIHLLITCVNITKKILQIEEVEAAHAEEKDKLLKQQSELKRKVHRREGRINL